MSKRRIFTILFLLILTVGYLLPENFSNPVEGADSRSYHPDSYWYYPWGKSGTHKGVDIFAREGTRVNAATAGLVLYAGNVNRGGNVVIVLGPKWHIHYYAHLQKLDIKTFSIVSGNEKIGRVGTTGNATGKAPHLHYSISTIIPYPWRIDESKQGWKKMFYLNPIEYLRKKQRAIG